MGLHIPATPPQLAAAYPDVPIEEVHPPPDGAFIQDRFSPVNINEWLTAGQAGFEVVQKCLHVGWNGSFEVDRLACSGMFEAQAGGMQSLPREVQKMAPKWLIYGLCGRWDATQVYRIANDRVPFAGQMHTYLMRAPCG